MAHLITLDTGLSNIALPNGLRYDGGAQVLLSDEEYSFLTASFKSTYLSADTVQSSGGGGGGGGSGLPVPTAVKTANYTAAAGDFVPCDTTSGSFTVTLPNAPADQTAVAVKMVIQGAANTITVSCAGSDVFNKATGGTTLTLSLLNQGILLAYKASSKIWYVVSDDLSLAALDLRYAQLAGAAFTGYTSPGVNNLIDASTILVDASKGNDCRVILGGNRTLANPTNLADGQPLTFLVTQDGTGTRLLSYGTIYSFSTSLPSPQLSTTPGLSDLLQFKYYAGSPGKLRFTGFVNGFS
jgi:hypothetical protein